MPLRINGKSFQDFLVKIKNPLDENFDRNKQIKLIIIRIALDIFTICILEAVLKYLIKNPKKITEQLDLTEVKTKRVSQQLHSENDQKLPVSTPKEQKVSVQTTQLVTTLEKQEASADPIPKVSTPKEEVSTQSTQLVTTLEKQEASADSIPQVSTPKEEVSDQAAEQSIKKHPYPGFNEIDFFKTIIKGQSEGFCQILAYLSKYVKGMDLRPVYRSRNYKAIFNDRKENQFGYIDTSINRGSVNSHKIALPLAPAFYVLDSAITNMSEYFTFLEKENIHHVVMLNDEIDNIKKEKPTELNLGMSELPDCKDPESLFAYVKTLAVEAKENNIAVTGSSNKAYVLLAVYYAYLLHEKNELNYNKMQIFVCFKLFIKSLIFNDEESSLIGGTIALFPKKD